MTVRLTSLLCCSVTSSDSASAPLKVTLTEAEPPGGMLPASGSKVNSRRTVPVFRLNLKSTGYLPPLGITRTSALDSCTRTVPKSMPGYFRLGQRGLTSML